MTFMQNFEPFTSDPPGVQSSRRGGQGRFSNLHAYHLKPATPLIRQILSLFSTCPYLVHTDNTGGVNECKKKYPCDIISLPYKENGGGGGKHSPS